MGGFEFLGVVLENNTIQMDPVKTDGVAKWPSPRTPTKVRSFLGFTGFYCYFIPNYSCIARPLLDLTKKGITWYWNDAQEQAFKVLKKMVCKRPVLAQPDYKKQFILHMDASAYGVGAVLLQEGEINPFKPLKPKLYPLAYFSATFTPMERNYDVYERELLAVIKALDHWRIHLGWTHKPIKIITDHANLMFWKSPRKLNRRLARWHTILEDYWYKVKHAPGKTHTATDFLSRPFVNDKGEHDNEDVVMIPPELFIRNLATTSTLNSKVHWAQRQHRPLMKEWENAYKLTKSGSTHNEQWDKDSRPTVPSDLHLKRQIMDAFHNAPTAGHPGRDETIRQVMQ